MNTQNLADLFLALPASVPSWSITHGSVTADIEVSRPVADSRLVNEQSIFCATNLWQTDGHDFILDALQRGTKVIVYRELPSTINTLDWTDRIFIQTANPSAWYAHMCSAWFGHPSKKLTVLGVTGTNGKTSTVWFIHQLLTKLGVKAGLLSTISQSLPSGELFGASNTTPGPFELHQFLRRCVDANGTHAVMEVSSHAMTQSRVAGICFAIGGFTNLTQDHLNYHKTMEAYAAAKRDFLQSLPTESTAVICNDHEWSTFMHEGVVANVLDVSTNTDEIFEDTLQPIHWEENTHGLKFVFEIDSESLETQTQLVGDFQVENVLVAIGSVMSVGFSLGDILKHLKTLHAPAGRLEPIHTAGSSIRAFVDYAHTPDALERVITTLQKSTVGKLIVVCGCGGDRDTTKRAPMAHIASRLGGIAIFTNDNPRTEHPEIILQHMQEGVLPEHTDKVLVIQNRKEAIAKAVEIAQDGDTILVAGKGHEDYQIIGTEKIHFSDKEVLEGLL